VRKIENGLQPYGLCIRGKKAPEAASAVRFRVTAQPILPVGAGPRAQAAAVAESIDTLAQLGPCGIDHREERHFAMSMQPYNPPGKSGIARRFTELRRAANRCRSLSLNKQG
ncbi:hypothetical protein, partial [Burkholderia multivorans]|uniref:hypothetical protein n=1 Tax=Burkholderia multivorans TaxID=87883 RepID=UPI0028702362